jgi:hypothetical protein
MPDLPGRSVDVGRGYGDRWPSTTFALIDAPADPETLYVSGGRTHRVLTTQAARHVCRPYRMCEVAGTREPAGGVGSASSGPRCRPPRVGRDSRPVDPQDRGGELQGGLHQRPGRRPRSTTTAPAATGTARARGRGNRGGNARTPWACRAGSPPAPSASSRSAGTSRCPAATAQGSSPTPATTGWRTWGPTGWRSSPPRSPHTRATWWSRNCTWRGMLRNRGAARRRRRLGRPPAPTRLQDHLAQREAARRGPVVSARMTGPSTGNDGRRIDCAYSKSLHPGRSWSRRGGGGADGAWRPPAPPVLARPAQSTVTSAPASLRAPPTPAAPTAGRSAVQQIHALDLRRRQRREHRRQVRERRQ